MARQNLSVVLATVAFLCVSVIARGDDQPARKAQPKLDRYGDPLPAGAALRLGTLRGRSPTSILRVAFLPDGQRLLAGGSEGAIHTFDLRDGRRTGLLLSHASGTALPHSSRVCRFSQPSARGLRANSSRLMLFSFSSL